MDESIFISIKQLLGIMDDSFDSEIIMHINSVFTILTQLGLGPEEGFRIESEDNTWGSFLQTRKDLDLVKTYIYMKVRLMFDPPQMSYLVESVNKQCTEFEWRLSTQVESSTG